MKRKMMPFLSLILAILAVVYVCFRQQPAHTVSDSIKNRPAYSGQPYVVINDNEPEFTAEDLDTDAYEFYSKQDHLGRCGYAMACLGQEQMPTEDRTGISHIKPSGWQSVTYEFIDGKYLYNRCHLIGFQLSGENDNADNLITGTRYFNTQGMLPFENMVADYIKETGNHVLYRVTPIYEEDCLVADGVQMEAMSVEDKGADICFNVFVYNVQPGVRIDYRTGESQIDEEQFGTDENTYILNTNSKRFHTESCKDGQSISQKNRQTINASREFMIAQGYKPCQACDP